MKAKATLKQIAKELNVSVSTVSKALNDSPEISELTKVKIKEYAKLKNYKPNVIGLNLKNRKTKTIGVIIPNILNSFFALYLFIFTDLFFFFAKIKILPPVISALTLLVYHFFVYISSLSGEEYILIN